MNFIIYYIIHILNVHVLNEFYNFIIYYIIHILNVYVLNVFYNFICIYFFVFIYFFNGYSIKSMTFVFIY